MVVFFITNFNLMYNGNTENCHMTWDMRKPKQKDLTVLVPCFQMLLCRRQLEEKKKERKNTPFKPWLKVKQAQRESITCMLNLAKRWHHLPCTLLLLKLQFLCTLMPRASHGGSRCFWGIALSYQKHERVFPSITLSL